jgi:hypothetical protein
MVKGILSFFLAVGFAVTPVRAQNYSSDITKTSAWLKGQQLPDGAILYSANGISPYFANLAAIGWLKDPSTIPQVEAWMQWYIGHVNWPDNNGLYGTVYNYSYSDGIETSTNSYDSADSSAATFLTLAEALYNTGNSGAQSFVQNTVGEYILNVTGNIITNLQRSNGLVFAKPDYPIEYLMDNSEDYRGLEDFANLAIQAWDDTSAASWYQAHASSIQSGIQSVLYISSTKLYYPYAGSSAPNMSRFYPDAVAQLYPAVQGVVAASSKQAKNSYIAFNAAWPGWTNLSFNSQTPFPWAVVSYAAYIDGDTSSVNKYITTLQKKYVNVTPDFPWPFYDAEAGWFIRANAEME